MTARSFTFDVTCGTCSGDLEVDKLTSARQTRRAQTVAEPALLRHGGYGATRTTTRQWCPCGWHLTAAVTLTTPR